MSNDHIQRQMNFIVEWQAKFSVDMEEMKESQKRLDAMIDRMAKEAEIERRETRAAINNLNGAVNGLNGAVNDLGDVVNNLMNVVHNVVNVVDSVANSVNSVANGVSSVANGVSSVANGVNSVTNVVNGVVIEMRDGFNNLIISNEVTRELASQAAKLAIQTSERMNRLEERPGS